MIINVQSVKGVIVTGGSDKIDGEQTSTPEVVQYLVQDLERKGPRSAGDSRTEATARHLVDFHKPE